MITLSVPFVLLVLCVVGAIAIAFAIGPVEDFNFAALILQLINLAFWIIALLGSLLLWEIFKR